MLINTQLFAQLTSTNLPIIKITAALTINDTMVQGSMDVIDNVSGINNVTDPATLNSMIGIKLRGNTVSQSYPKKSYTIETWNGFNVTNNISVLGLPAENDWVLLSAYSDRSLMRSMLSFKLHDKMGRYAPRMKYCELILNNTYKGVYLFGEVVKRDTGRLSLSNLRPQDNFGDQLTGGYILSVDDESGAGWTSNYAPPFASTSQTFQFLYEYPKSSEITPAQQDYIKSYVDSFENALNAANFQDTLLGWRAFGANNSFIDFILVNELTKNVDAYRLDMYLYKDKLTKLRPGPLWGFDDALYNTQNCSASVDTGYAFNFGQSCSSAAKLPSFWWPKLMTDTQFVNDLKCRYTEFRQAGGVLDSIKIISLIDSFGTVLNAQNAQTRNFTLYPIFGTPIVNEPMPMALNHTGELINLKEFIKRRLSWLDSKWLINLGSCPSYIGTANYDLSGFINIFPNPVSESFTIQSNPKLKNATLDIVDMQGKILYSSVLDETYKTISIRNFANGIYLVKVKDDKGAIGLKKIIKQ